MPVTVALSGRRHREQLTRLYYCRYLLLLIFFPFDFFFYQFLLFNNMTKTSACLLEECYKLNMPSPAAKTTETGNNRPVVHISKDRAASIIQSFKSTSRSTFMKVGMRTRNNIDVHWKWRISHYGVPSTARIGKVKKKTRTTTRLVQKKKKWPSLAIIELSPTLLHRFLKIVH